jgi:threonine dehydrogenase-like Zn-dependent dehydrogenase
MVGGAVPLVTDHYPQIIFNVATIFGSWTFSKSELIAIAQFMVEVQVPLQTLITHRYAVDQADEAFRIFDGATTGKCVFALS